jgi:hypothetical protein
MKKRLLVVVAAAGLTACTFPQTKMEPVGSTQMQTQASTQPAADDAAATSAPASAQSAGAAR